MPIIEAQEADSTHLYGYIHITISDYSNVSRFTINGTEYTESVELDSLRGGIYTMHFYNDYGCTISEEIRMCRYMIFQRWNDVISLMNENYEGGGVFTAYQWYENGLPIEGATRSYYHKVGGFSVNDYYTCLVTLPDGTQEMSCVFVPAVYSPEEQISVSPSFVQSGQNVVVRVPAKAQVHGYNTMGIPVFTAEAEEGENMLPLSMERGMYIIVVTVNNGDKVFKVVVE